MAELPKLPHLSRFSEHPALAHIKKIFTRKRIIIFTSVVLAFLVITPIATYAYYARDIANRDRLMNRNNTGLVLKDRHGEVFYEYGKMADDDDVPLSKISDNLEHAVVASEDSSFYTHPGYSLRGIAGAMYADITHRSATKYGGSTITQQLVKNKLLTSNKNFFRKYQEVSMAVAIERKYTKDQILDMYLNSVYFGEGAFGIKDAARTYFNETPADLTVAQSAMLVGLLPAPSLYSPISGDMTLAKARQAYVLKRMDQLGYIDKDTRQTAAEAKLAYAHTDSSDFIHAQHYAMMVINELEKKYGDERITRSGFEVTTGLDLSWQKQAEAIIKKRVETFAPHGGRNAGLVAIDPNSGEVRALVGSVDWNNPTFGKYNMALAERQPGSSFKPIYYSEAFDKHLITPATIMHDRPTTFGDWTPVNYDNHYRGDITIRNALATSLNIPAAEVMQKLGVDAAAAAAERMGVTTIHNPESYGLTLALGTAEVQLYQMTNVYAAFAHGGEQFPPVLITSIKDKYGDTIYSSGFEKSHRVQSAQASFLITSILSDNNARAPSYGSSLNIPGHQAAVKTGTTNDNKDAWTYGYTPSIAIGVWVGNNENEPMHGLAGGSSAGKIWRDSMIAFLKDLPNKKFTPPPGITEVRICRGTELRAPSGYSNSFSEYFINGTAPTGECRVQRVTSPKKEDKKPPEQKQEDKEQDNKPGRGGDGTTEPPPTDGGTGTGDTTNPTPTDPTPPEPPPDEQQPPPTPT